MNRYIIFAFGMAVLLVAATPAFWGSIDSQSGVVNLDITKLAEQAQEGAPEWATYATIQMWEHGHGHSRVVYHVGPKRVKRGKTWIHVGEAPIRVSLDLETDLSWVEVRFLRSDR